MVEGIGVRSKEREGEGRDINAYRNIMNLFMILFILLTVFVSVFLLSIYMDGWNLLSRCMMANLLRFVLIFQSFSKLLIVCICWMSLLL